MRELHATAVVDEQGDLELRLHTDLPPGRHELTLLFAEPTQSPASTWKELPHFSVGAILPAFSLDREVYYDELEPNIEL
jgi:hypothetical protein